MKKIILYISIFFLPIIAHSQNWQWAKQVGSNIVQSYDYGRVITDGVNSYLVGRYSNAIYLQTDTLNSNGYNDLFIIKYDASGNELWAKSFGGDGGSQNELEDVVACFDPVSNSIYLSGRFAGNMNLETVDTLHSYGSLMSLFIAKMDLNGNFIWGKAINDTVLFPSLFVTMAEVFCSPNGTVYITAGINDTTNFQGNILYPGGCMLKFDSNSNCLLARNININKENRLQISFLNNDLILSGSFRDPVFTLDTATVLNSGTNSFDFYISRTDTNGNVKWLKNFGFGGNDGIGSLDVNHTYNEIYFCSTFQDSISINSNTLYNTGRDILFGKFDEFGNTIWLRQSNVSNTTGGGSSLKVDNNGNFYVAGSFAGSIKLGTFTISTTNTLDMFLARYNSIGDCLGVNHFGYASGLSLVIDNSGNPICSGGFQNTVTIGTNTFTSNGYVDIYLAKCDVFTGIGEEGRAKNNQLLIYANPNQGKCTINVPDDFLNERNLTLSILDNTGKLIQQKTLFMNEGKIKLNLEQEAKGIYNVVLTNNVKSYYGKIVFE